MKSLVGSTFRDLQNPAALHVGVLGGSRTEDARSAANL